MKKLWALLLARFGWNEASENHLSPSHGWLLPAPALLRERARPVEVPGRRR